MKSFLKQCPKCRKQKWSTEFHKDKNYSDGLNCWCKECHSKKSVEHNRKHPERCRNSKLKQKYGITLKQYELMLKLQNGVCAICKQPEKAKGTNGEIKHLAVDHDHSIGKIRELLCSKCNPMLGVLENKEWCERAADYLEKHK